MKLRDVGEFGLISRLAALVDSGVDDVIVGIGDDAAVVRAGRSAYTILTTDTLVENVHFRLEGLNPRDLGHKAMAANLSDVAAMAGLPRFCLVALGLPPGLPVEFVEELYRGLIALGDRHQVKLVGGDTAKSACLMVSLTVLGEVEPDKLRLRAGAKPGDRILVTGDLGRSAAGLQLVLDPALVEKVGTTETFLERHWRPEPRVAAARLASELGCTAIEDISDGLASEIVHICQASATGAVLDLRQLPLSAALVAAAPALGGAPEEIALTSGEEYELVITAPAAAARQITERMPDQLNLPTTDVGQIRPAGEGLTLTALDGTTGPLRFLGYEHFK